MDLKNIFEEHNNSVFRFAMFKLNNKEDAEEIVSETFATLMGKDLSKIQNIKAWLMGIAKRKIVDLLRKKKMVNIDSQIEEIIQDDFIVEDQILKKELIKLVLKNIKSKPQFEQDILVLKVWEEMTFEEIAKILKSNVNTVKTTYYRLIELMEKELNKDKKLFAIAPISIFAMLKSHKNFLLSDLSKQNILNKFNFYKKNKMEEEKKVHNKSKRKGLLMGGTLILLTTLILGCGFGYTQLNKKDSEDKEKTVEQNQEENNDNPSEKPTTEKPVVEDKKVALEIYRSVEESNSREYWVVNPANNDKTKIELITNAENSMSIYNIKWKDENTLSYTSCSFDTIDTCIIYTYDLTTKVSTEFVKLDNYIQTMEWVPGTNNFFMSYRKQVDAGELGYPHNEMLVGFWDGIKINEIHNYGTIYPTGTTVTEYDLWSGFSFSPDNQFVVFMQKLIYPETTAVIATVKGQKIADLGDFAFPLWLDNDTFVYLDRGTDKFMKYVVSTKETTVFKEGISPLNLKLSPDGKKLLFWERLTPTTTRAVIMDKATLTEELVIDNAMEADWVNNDKIYFVKSNWVESPLSDINYKYYNAQISDIVFYNLNTKEEMSIFDSNLVKPNYDGFNYVNIFSEVE